MDSPSGGAAGAWEPGERVFIRPLRGYGTVLGRDGEHVTVRADAGGRRAFRPDELRKVSREEEAAIARALDLSG